MVGFDPPRDRFGVGVGTCGIIDGRGICGQPCPPELGVETGVETDVADAAAA